MHNWRRHSYDSPVFSDAVRNDTILGTLASVNFSTSFPIYWHFLLFSYNYLIEEIIILYHLLSFSLLWVFYLSNSYKNLTHIDTFIFFYIFLHLFSPPIFFSYYGFIIFSNLYKNYFYNFYFLCHFLKVSFYLTLFLFCIIIFKHINIKKED